MSVVAQYLMTKTAMQLGREGIGGRPEVKPHQCQQCLKSFSSNHQLVQHIRSVPADVNVSKKIRDSLKASFHT